MNRLLMYIFLLICLCSIIELRSQVLTEFLQISGPGSETIERMAIADDGAICVTGLFDQSIPFGEDNFTTLGSSDVFWACFEPNGSMRWARTGGSMLNDETAALATDIYGNILASGTFWFNAQFDDISISADLNPKGIFLLKFNDQGETVWAKAINGSGLKGVGGVATDREGNIWLSGYFGGRLEISDSVLIAEGITDLFLAKFSPDGTLLWALREGQQGDTRATVLTVLEDKVVIGGFFNSQTVIAGISLTANTSDRDIFLAAYSLDGQPVWAKKAGGVHDDEITAIDSDEDGNIYATGFFVGVMNLGDGIIIQSATGNPDFFLLKYNSNGTPILGRSFGGSLTQMATSMMVKGGRIAVCGQFQGLMSWDNLTLNANGPFAGFFATFNTQLQGIWAQSLSATQGLFPIQVMVAPDGRLWSAGSFSGLGSFPSGQQSSVGAFDGFMIRSADPVRSIQITETKTWKAYPNPTPGEVFISGSSPIQHIHVFDGSGRFISSHGATLPINIRDLPDGKYYLSILSDGKSAVAPIVKSGN